MEVLGDSFSKTSSSENYHPNFLAFKILKEELGLKIPEDNIESYNLAFSFAELDAALSECQGSSPGPDGIHYDMIKNLPLIGKIELLKIYNDIFQNKKFPNNWRKALIIPILKAGKDPKYAKNYRPISLTNCLCKILERMINKRLMWFLETNGFLSDFQSAFRRGRSTADNLAYLESNIMETFCDRKFLLSIFFDIEKAYDTTWRLHILNEMLSLGLKGNLVFFVANFLKHRTFRVSSGNAVSNEKVQENGIF